MSQSDRDLALSIALGASGSLVVGLEGPVLLGLLLLAAGLFRARATPLHRG